MFLSILFDTIGAVFCIFMILFSSASVKEKKYRAAFISFMLLVPTVFLWLGTHFLFPVGYVYKIVFGGGGLLLIVLFYFPLGSRKLQNIPGPLEKADEKDTMFARGDYKEGSPHYDIYYKMRPENKKIDDKMRKFPPLLEPGGKFYDPVRSNYIKSLFVFEEKLSHFVDGPVHSEKMTTDINKITEYIKTYTLHLGAEEVGIAKLNPAWIYSHVGRGPEEWGSETKNDHKYVIPFIVEMRYEKVEEAPDVGITEETAIQYLNTQKISIALAEFIRQLGYSARAQVPGSNYQIMLPPAAYAAGLGEMGRMGYLISQKFGARVRIGAVTTDLPLTPDKPVDFGVQDFCEKCKKCAVNCPSNSIPHEEKTVVRGVEKWQLNVERCFMYWRVIGTDCGLCMKVCPFSHPDSMVHTVLRKGIKNSSLARTLSIHGDDLFYGKTVKFPKFPD